MLNRLRLLLACFALTLLLPCAALAEDDPKPTKDDPAPAEEPTDEPAEGETPKDETPKDETPKGEDPKDKPAKGEDPKDEDPKDEDPKDDGEPKEGSSTTAKPPMAQGDSPAPVPAGMAYLEGGRVWIGSEQDFLSGLLAGRPPEHRKLFNFEVPRHTRFLRPYFIRKFEVSNAQYERFLEDAAPVVYDTASGSLANLDEIAAHLVRLSPEQRKNPKQAVWLQLYTTNKDLIWKAFEVRLDEFLVKRKDKTIDEYATARKFRFVPLPRTLKLTFFSVRLPHNWPDVHPPKGQEDHPVRFVSYNDAERFAEWAGMHIPTEFEWEWAARGPSGSTFPWGNQWPPNALYANWGGKITDSHFEPTTLPVASRNGSNAGGEDPDAPLDGDGRSWSGCHHMVGNVAEWTSSWFELYPDTSRKKRTRHSLMGRYIKVLRGGGAGDGVMLVLRAGCRNFIGGGADAPPYPDNFFKWVGFRLGAYMKTGRDPLGPILRRADAANKMKEANVDTSRFIGSVTRNWVEPDATPDNHVYIRGRANSIVFVPLNSFLRGSGMADMIKAWKRPERFKKRVGLAKKSETADPFFLLGVLHSDISMQPVLVRKPVDPEQKNGKKKRSGRGRARAPETVEGECPPGTYLFAIWFGRLAILTPSGEFVAFVPPPSEAEKRWSAFNVVKVDADEIQPNTLAIDGDLDCADFRFSMPLGGKNVDAKYRLVVKSRLPFEVGALDEAGTWLQDDPAAELTARLRKEYAAAEIEAAKNKKKAPKKKKKKTSKKTADTK